MYTIITSIFNASSAVGNCHPFFRTCSNTLWYWICCFFVFFYFLFFYSPMLTTTSFSYLTLPFFQQGYSIVSLFHLSLYVDSPVSELSNYPCSSFFLELFWLNPSMFLFFFSKDTSMFYIIPGHCTHCYSFRKALNSYSSAHVGNSKLN